MPLSHKQTHKLLEELGHQPRKQLGQNFLVDGNIVQKSVRLADLQTGEQVVEVGPGLGTLTGCMLGYGAHVYAVEFDKRLHQHLSETLGAEYPQSFDLLYGDALDFPLAKLPVQALREQAEQEAAAKAQATRTATPAGAAPLPTPAAGSTVKAEEAAATTLTAPFKIIANLPYAISTPWLEAVLSGPIRPRRLVLMLQKETAERFIAEPGSKTYGAISIYTASAYRVAASHAVSRQCFFPIPGVDSVLLSLEALPNPQPWPPLARSLVRQFFIHRRKQIGSLARRAIEEAEAQANRKPSARERAASAASDNADDADAASLQTASELSQIQQQTPRQIADTIARELTQWLTTLEQMGVSTETRPEAIPLAAWQQLAQRFVSAE